MPQPPMNNLGPGGSRLGFLPGVLDRASRALDRASRRLRDQSPGTSTGTTGTSTGGTPRRSETEPKPPSLREGAFTVDQTPERPGTSMQYRFPSTEDGPIEAANKFQKCGEHLESGDQEPDEGLGETIASMEAPPDGMVYALEPQPDGSIAIVCVPDDGEDLSTNDRTFRHRIRDGRDPVLSRMNRINRYRSRPTRDWASTQPSTLFRHKALLPGQRLELQGPDEFGGYDLCLFSSTSDLTGAPPPASGNKAKEDNRGTMRGPQAWASAAGAGELDIHALVNPIRTGDRRRLTEPQMLAAQNRRNAEFWQRQRSA